MKNITLVLLEVLYFKSDNDLIICFYLNTLSNTNELNNNPQMISRSMSNTGYMN